MNDDTKALIGASIRTTLVGLPSLPGLPNFAAMLAQGWSEYENHQFQTRVDEFIGEVKSRLESLEALQIGDLQRLLAIEAQTALLEEAISASSREPQPEKRKAFADFYVAAITGRLGNDHDSVRTLLQALEALTPSDLRLLARFLPNGTCTGDGLSDSWMPEWGSVERDPLEDSKWDEKLTPTLLSITKLETRGLIIETRRPSAFQHSGDNGAWYNVFRHKAWRITKPGRQLLSAISDH